MDSVEITCEGPARVHQEAALGTYVKTAEIVQGYPTYQQVEEGKEKNLVYVDDQGYWTAGLEPKLRNPKIKPTPKLPPRTGWLYNHRGEWFQDKSITASVKVGGELTGSFPMEGLLIKLGLEKYIPAFLENGYEDLNNLWNLCSYGNRYDEDETEEPEGIKQMLEMFGLTSVDDRTKLRKEMKISDSRIVDLIDECSPASGVKDVPNFPYNVFTVDHGAPVRAVTFSSSNSDLLFTGGEGGYVRVWHMNPRTFDDIDRLSDDIDEFMHISHRCRKFSTPFAQIDLGETDSVAELGDERQIPGRNVVMCMHFFHVHAFFSLLLVGGVFEGHKSMQLIQLHEYQPKPLEILEIGAYGKTCLDVAVSSDMQFIYCCHSTKNDMLEEDSMVEIWNLKGVRVGLLKGHEAPVTSISISNVSSQDESRDRYGSTPSLSSENEDEDDKEMQKLISGSKDGTVILWDLTTREEIHKLKLDGEIVGVAFSPSNDRVVVAMNGNDVYVVNGIESGNMEVEEKVEMDAKLGPYIHYPEGEPRFRAITPKIHKYGNWFLTAGMGISGCALTGGQKLFSMSAEATCSDISSDGEFIAVGTHNPNAQDQCRVEVLRCCEKNLRSPYI